MPVAGLPGFLRDAGDLLVQLRERCAEEPHPALDGLDANLRPPCRCQGLCARGGTLRVRPVDREVLLGGVRGALARLRDLAALDPFDEQRLELVREPAPARQARPEGLRRRLRRCGHGCGRLVAGSSHQRRLEPGDEGARGGGREAPPVAALSAARSRCEPFAGVRSGASGASTSDVTSWKAGTTFVLVDAMPTGGSTAGSWPRGRSPGPGSGPAPPGRAGASVVGRR